MDTSLKCVEQQISHPKVLTLFNIYFLENQPIFHYYYINIMAVRKCTDFRMNKIQYLMSADSSIRLGSQLNMHKLKLLSLFRPASLYPSVPPYTVKITVEIRFMRINT